MRIVSDLRPVGSVLGSLFFLFLLTAGCSTPEVPADVIDLAPGQTNRAWVQLIVKSYDSHYLTEVFVLNAADQLQRIGVIGEEHRDSPEFFSHQLQKDIKRLTVAVPPDSTARFLLRSYDMPKPHAFQVKAPAGLLVPVYIHKEAEERSYIFEIISRRWRTEIRPAVAPKK